MDRNSVVVIQRTRMLQTAHFEVYERVKKCRKGRDFMDIRIAIARETVDRFFENQNPPVHAARGLGFFVAEMRRADFTPPIEVLRWRLSNSRERKQYERDAVTAVFALAAM